MSSEAFAGLVVETIRRAEKEKSSPEPDDIEEWLKLFGG